VLRTSVVALSVASPTGTPSGRAPCWANLTSQRSPTVLECAYVPSQFRFPVIGVKQLRADNFITTALFYLILSSLPGRYSFDHWAAKPKPNDPQSLGFWSRVLPVHLCLIYFISGLAKFLGNGRWDGSNPWRSLIRPPFNLQAVSKVPES
jgi:hypothetical protein